MAILEALGGILGLKLAILERLGAHLEALGGQGRHMVGIYEAYGRHMGGIWEAKRSKREPQKNVLLGSGGMRGARVLISICL